MPAVMTVATPVSDLTCADALPIMIAPQSAAIIRGDIVEGLGKLVSVMASAFGLASADRIERRSNVKVVCMRCTPHPKQKIVPVSESASGIDERSPFPHS